MDNRQLKLLKKSARKDINVAERVIMGYLGKHKLPIKHNLKLAAGVIINQQIKNEMTYSNFNKVLTILLNTLVDLKDVQKFQLDNKDVSEELEDIIIGTDYMVFCSGDESLLSNKSEDYCIVKRNGNLHILISKKFSDNNIVNTAMYDNYFDETSVLLPIINRKYKNSSILNGKNWVKHYTFNKEEGYLYFLKLNHKDKICYKVGISKHGVLKRFGKSKYVQDYTEIPMNMLYASILEQYIHSSNFNLRFHFAELDDNFEGKNECYYVDMIEQYNNLDMQLVLKFVAELNNIDPLILISVLKSQGVNID